MDARSLFFHIASEVWLLFVRFFFLISTSLPDSASERARSKMLLSMHVALVHADLTQERRKDGKNKHIHVQSNVHHIFKHISKSSDFEIISQNKSIFFSQPIRYLYLDCTIYVYMSNHEGPKQQK